MTEGSAWRRRLVIAIPYAWLLIFLAAPFAIVLKIAVSESIIAQPPYADLLAAVDELIYVIKLNFQNFAFLLEDDLYWKAYLSSIRISFVSTLFCIVIGYPMAYGIARSPRRRRALLLLLVILPFWTSFLIRVYAWKVILQGNGVLNSLLIGLGIIDQPLTILYGTGAVYIGIVYTYLPFMILPLYAALERQDPSLVEAATDLGSRPWRTFLTITLPLSLPGLIAGSLLVFIPVVGEFVIPELLGGPDSLMIGRVLWTEFVSNRDWPVASAVAIAVLLLLVVPIMAFEHFRSRRQVA